MIVWRLRRNIIRTALCWIVWHNVRSQQHTYVSSSYRFNRLGLLHWDPYDVHRGGCLELYYCNMVEWFRWDSSLILTTNWFPSVLWHCWFGHLTCKNRPRNDLLCVEWDVKPYTLTHSLLRLRLLPSNNKLSAEKAHWHTLLLTGDGRWVASHCTNVTTSTLTNVPNSYLTLQTAEVSTGYILPSRSNLIFNFGHSGTLMSARVPECQKVKIRLDLDGTEQF